MSHIIKGRKPLQHSKPANSALEPVTFLEPKKSSAVGPLTISPTTQALTEKLSSDLGYASGTLSHCLVKGMLSNFILSPEYSADNDHQLLALRRALKTNFISLNRVLQEVEQEYQSQLGKLTDV